MSLDPWRFADEDVDDQDYIKEIRNSTYEKDLKEEWHEGWWAGIATAALCAVVLGIAWLIW